MVRIPQSPRPKRVVARAPRVPVEKNGKSVMQEAVRVPVAKPPKPKKVKEAPAPKEPSNPNLYTWHGLQEVLREVSTAAEAQEILQYEIEGPARLRWMLRIQGRINTLRSEEEIAFLESIAKE